MRKFEYPFAMAGELARETKDERVKKLLILSRELYDSNLGLAREVESLQRQIQTLEAEIQQKESGGSR